MPTLTRNAILDYLDKCVLLNPGCFFMDLGHGYFHTANSRLSLFGDGEDWAIVFEKFGYANRSMSMQLELNYFGSDLHSLQPGGLHGEFSYNSKYFDLVTLESLDEIKSDFEEVSPSARQVKLRETIVQLPVDLAQYARWIPQREPGPVRFEDLGRYLAFEYEAACRGTMEELRTCLPDGLPLLMHIDAWHHRRYYYYVNGAERAIIGEKPSSYETFPMLADVLANTDASLFQPTLPPTNHWSHWPEAGSL